MQRTDAVPMPQRDHTRGVPENTSLFDLIRPILHNRIYIYIYIIYKTYNLWALYGVTFSPFSCPSPVRMHT